MRPYVGNDDLVRIGIDYQVGVVRDYYYLTFAFCRRRAWSYLLLRMSRLKACPHKVSIGFAAGAFASFLPFVGLHFVIAAALAVVVRGSVIASAIGTVVGNPITFPLIWFATYKIGVVLTGQSVPYDHGYVDGLAKAGFGFYVEYFSGVWQSLSSAVWPMLVGALPLGLFCASLCYALVYMSIRGFRRPAPPTARSPHASAL